MMMVCVVIGLFRVKAEIATNLDFNCGRRRPLEPLTTWLRLRLCSRDGTLDSPSRGICRLNQIKQQRVDEKRQIKITIL